MDDKVQRTLNGIPYATGGTGGKISSDGFSNLTACANIHLQTTQNVSASTNTKILLSSVDFDISSCWNQANYRYIVKTGGIYSVTGSVQTNITLHTCKLMLYKNGSFLMNLHNEYSSEDLISYKGTVGIKVLANDYLELWFMADGSCTLQVTDTFMFVHRIY